MTSPVLLIIAGVSGAGKRTLDLKNEYKQASILGWPVCAHFLTPLSRGVGVLKRKYRYSLIAISNNLAFI